MKLNYEVGLIFDLDGTLWDAIDPIMQSWNKAMSDNGKHYRFTYEMIKSYMGLTPIETVKLAFDDVCEEEGLHLFSICIKEEIKYLSTKPGIIYKKELETVEFLSKKYPLFIVSNCDSGYIENFLYGCNMKKYFLDYLCIGDTKKEKWENILLIKEKYNINKVIYIGDTLKDKTETLKANSLFIHAAYGFGQIENDEYFINSIDELPRIIEDILN